MTGRVLVAGGTGYLGRRLLPALRARGYAVSALVRGGVARAAGLPHLAGCDVFEGDVLDAGACLRAAAGARTVVNLVGILREQGRATFEAMHVRATENLLAAARAAGAERFVYVSAIGARADAPTRYWRTKFAAEERVRASGLAWLVLRPSIVFAPDGEFYRLLAQLSVVPIVPVLGPGTTRFAPIRADDLAAIELAALERPATWNRVHEVAGPTAYTFNQLVTRVARGLGRRVVLVHLPLALARPAVAGLSKVLPFLPVTADQLAMLGEDSVADAAAVESAFGLRPRPVDPILDRSEAA